MIFEEIHIKDTQDGCHVKVIINQHSYMKEGYSLALHRGNVIMVAVAYVHAKVMHATRDALVKVGEELT